MERLLKAKRIAVETVRESVRQAAEAVGPLPAAKASELQKMVLGTSALAAVFEGDFAAAEQGARVYGPLVASSKWQSAHGAVASGLAQILEVAVEYGHIARNPAKGKRRRAKASRPARSPPSRRNWSHSPHAPSCSRWTSSAPQRRARSTGWPARAPSTTRGR